MVLTSLAALVLVLAAVPAWLFRTNLPLYQSPLAPPAAAPLPRVSILIPARNEQRSIQAAVESALMSEGVELEVVVLDDHSDDATPAIVRRLIERDARVRLLDAPELPDGWCGKQHACWVLANNASHSLLLFLDADVRLAPSGLARLIGFLERSRADLVSAIPLQETQTLAEQLLISLIPFLLLGFLPIRRMRASRNPAYGAGCGQLFLARRSSYEAMGGHSAIRGTLHDGIKLPRAFRSAGLMTDLCDGTEVARCRMYRGATEVWHGLAKNAREGLATAQLIVPGTLVLLFGQVLPVVLVLISVRVSPAATLVATAATACAYYPRLAAVLRFRQRVLAAVLHPVGILTYLAIQWYALLRHALGRPSFWKGRTYGQPGRSSQKTFSRGAAVAGGPSICRPASENPGTPASAP